MRIVIDTDVAMGVLHEGRARDIDDAYAIVEALNEDLIDLVGITTVYGNGPLAEVDRVARAVVDLKGAETPVRTGAAASDDRGTNEAVDFLAASLRAGPLHIAAIGPLTNIALLIERYPEEARSIESVVIVAGRTEGNDFYIGDAGPVNDFNFENDPQAAHVLLQSGVPTVCAGFELTSQVVVTRDDVAAIADHGALGAFFHEQSQPWLDFMDERFPTDAGFHPWDSAAIAWLTHPEWFTCETRGAAVDFAPETPRLNTFTEPNESPVTYLTGFAPDAAKQFIASIVGNIY